MKKVVINKVEYEVIRNEGDCLDTSILEEKITDYFDPYDYILGDWSYGKLRLKGFCDKVNKNCNRINDIKYKDKYIKELCSYDCRYFILKKVK